MSPASYESSWQEFQRKCSSWDQANRTLLRKLFTDGEVASHYHNDTALPPDPSKGVHKALGEELRVALRELRSLRDRLHLYEEATTSVTRATHRKSGGRRVFVVHGHDDAVLQATARFLERLDLEPVILREQPNKGRTIIEKFVDYADVHFAIVLLTPDDRGGPHDAKYEQQQLRARQNVMLELGFFLGALGRANVCALYRAGVEIPSDYVGVLFVPLDDRGAWKMDLARELKVAGLPIDMNKAV